MVREAFNLFIHVVGIQSFDGLDNPGVAGAPTLLKKASIGYLLRERMLERVFELRKQACLVENSAACRWVSAPRRASSGSSAMACSSGNGTSLPMTAAV
jgi:hypothetical protein